MLFVYLYSVSYNDDDDETNYISIKADLDIDDTQYGILVEYGYVFLYAFSMLYFGGSGDIYNRKYLISIGILLSSTSAIVLGVSESFWHVFLSRLLLGLGSGFFTPSAFSIISDLFHDNKLIMSNSIFVCGIYIGVGLASLSMISALDYGWRNTSYMVGIIGYILFFITFLILIEPERKEHDKSNKMDKEKLLMGVEGNLGYKDTLKLVWNSKFLTLLFLASCMHDFSGFILFDYSSIFYEDIYSSDETTFTYLNAAIFAIIGTVSNIFGGHITKRFLDDGDDTASLMVPMYGFLGSIPFIIGFLFIPNFYVSLIFLCFTFVSEISLGPISAEIIKHVTIDSKAKITSIWISVKVIFGSIGSYLAGQLIDIYTNNENEHLSRIKWILSLLMIPALLTASIILYYLKDIKKKEDESSEIKPLLDDKSI